MKTTLLTLSCLIYLSCLAQIENGIIAHFPFNNSLEDISVNNITATNNGALFTPDRNGNANFGLDFSNSYYLSINDNSVKTAFPVTISVWVKINSFNSNNVIFTSDNIFENYYGYWMNVNQTSGIVAISFGAGLGTLGSSNRRSFATTNGLTLGVWHHIVGTINAYDDMAIYVDCIQQAGTYSGTGSTSISYSSSESRIGNNIGNNANPSGSYFDGSMDQFVIWDRALTDGEIMQMCDTDNQLKVEDLNTEVVSPSLYPNPTNGIFTLSSLDANQNYHVRILTMDGKVMDSIEIENATSASFDLSNYTSQVYIVELVGDDRMNTLKVIKE